TYEENDVIEEEGQGVFDILSSSAARGSLVHEEIEYAIKHNLVRPMTTTLDERTSKGVDWIIEELKALSENSNLVSEEPLKFSLFGQMISGIPDLVIYSKEGVVTEIWDFKTGRYNEEKSKPYWLQLEAYGYGLTHSGFKNEVKLVLAFIDEKELVVRNLDRNDLEESLFETWQQLSNLERINQEHCKHCEYSQLCQLN
ncbi:MAG: PD-(D/E)XK nuclease family protein, partial [Bdellovibrionota bacterium]|nr:PD-(D/E)XK nuclease family protein [Bdellovibrionota bacterium]